jgi:hypothetical protein
MLRGQRGWPIVLMLLSGSLTVWFNLQHAGNDPGRRLAAALPPILMMLAFEVDISIVRWVMNALGKPMHPLAPPPPAGLPGPVPGIAYQADGLPVWNGPGQAPPGWWPPGASGQIPAAHHLPENPRYGQTGWGRNGVGDPAGVTKRQRIEAYLDRLGSEQVNTLTVRELAADLAAEGVEVTERYVKQVLDQRRPPAPARRGSGARRPRPRR